MQNKYTNYYIIMNSILSLFLFCCLLKNTQITYILYEDLEDIFQQQQQQSKQ